MATYKVIQDIEAEDKLIGWLTPRQTIYVAIVFMSGFVWWMLINAGAWWLGLIFIPHMALLLMLSGPFVHDQPSEVWLLAKIKFFLQPKRRIWDQSGMKELVNITVPKKIEKQYTDGLSQTQVKSRLSALASTLDSRGWAVKNIDTNPYIQPFMDTPGDRLVNPVAIPQAVPDFNIPAQNDILDETSNPVAQQLGHMIDESSQAHRQQIIEQMKQSPAPTQAPNDHWFLNSSGSTSAPDGFPSSSNTPPGMPTDHAPTPQQNINSVSPEEQVLLSKIHSEQAAAQAPNKNMRTIRTTENRAQEVNGLAEHAAAQKQAQVNNQLAGDNDKTVASISRQANKALSEDDGEVVISLH